MTEPDGTRYSDASVEAITQAYYARATVSPDTARGRAQAAYGVASAVAGGLVAAAVISKFGSAQWLLQLLGIATVALWLTATSLYLYAVAVPVRLRSSTSQARGSTAFVNAVIERAIEEREAVDGRQKRANILAALAMSFTLLTFALGILLPSQSFFAIVTVSGTPGAPGGSCPAQPHVITGEVVTTSLETNLVNLRNARLCGQAVPTLYINRQLISEIRSGDGTRRH